ncbi:MAG: ABC transporter ATP-binding protein [Acholeplasma sp.]|nr:ABC transporter ATP-binding protein [Acholeplasma sp.]
MDIILSVSNLKKSFGDIKAVNDISFNVRRGSLFAFLGPNGAGKSTTINMISTLLEKDNGKILLNNQSDDTYFRHKIGVVFQANILDNDLTVKENLIYRGALYINDQKGVLKRYEELKSYLRLDEFENQRFKTLSGGQKRRAEIARALFSNPEILFLDEPTTGLDPETRQVVWRVIDQLRKEKGMTIFLTTHYMEEAAIADHVVIINKGVIVAEGTPTELKSKHSYDRLKIVPIDKKTLTTYLDSIKKPYFKISDEYIMQVDEATVAIDIICNQKDNIKQFEVIKGTMDDVFIEVIGSDQHV